MGGTVTLPQRQTAHRGESYANRKMRKHAFDGQDLRHYDFRGATLIECSFKDADLSYANFEGANCWGSDFTGAKCYKVNFKDTDLSSTKMFPREFFGCTITLHCDTFRNMEISEKWYKVWLMFATMMIPPDHQLMFQLINIIGKENYGKLRDLFDHRMM